LLRQLDLWVSGKWRIKDFDLFWFWKNTVVDGKKAIKESHEETFLSE
jgi:hypothetical protein